MNIVVVTDGVYPYTMGGSHRLVYELCQELSVHHKVWCIIPEVNESVQMYCDPNSNRKPVDFTIVRFSVNRKNVLSAIYSYFTGFSKTLKSIQATHVVDIINVHYIPALFSLIIGFRKSLKYCYTFHGPWSRELRLDVLGKAKRKSLLSGLVYLLVAFPFFYLAAAIEKYCLRRCYSYTALSTYMKDILVNDFRVTKDIVLIPGGVSRKDFFPVASDNLRNALGLKKRYVFLTVRRLVERMGIAILIEACAMLKERYDDFVLLIGGSGYMRDVFNQSIFDKKCGDNIRLVGFIPESQLVQYYSLADLFILPSRDLEGFGLVVLESMASGTPVLVSPFGGAKEIVSLFNEKFVLPDLKPSIVADVLYDFIRSGELISIKGENAVSFVAEKYSWKKYASEYIEWFRAV